MYDNLNLIVLFREFNDMNITCFLLLRLFNTYCFATFAYMNLSQIKLENDDNMDKCMPWGSYVTASYQLSWNQYLLRWWSIDIGLVFSFCLNGFVLKSYLSSGNELAIHIMTLPSLMDCSVIRV